MLKYRFSKIIQELNIDDAPPEYHEAVIAFINSLVHSTEDVAERIRLRNELVGIGLADRIAYFKLRASNRELLGAIEVGAHEQR